MFEGINFNDIIVKFTVLVVFYKVIDTYPELQKYKKTTRFSMYRSLLCITFTLLSFIGCIKHFNMGYSFPYEYHTEDFSEIIELFIAYIIFDLVKMIKDKCTRKDLYFHHIFVLIVSFIYTYNGCGGFICVLLIFAEIISVVSGIDSIAMEDNKMEESMFYKKIRKAIIKYIRLPLWIIFFLFTTKYVNRIPKTVIMISYIAVFVMIYLDTYWEKKCDKIIDKYKSK